MNNDAHLIYEAYQASTDQEYTKFNLEVHQLANKPNIRVMLQYVEDELGGSGADPFKKQSLIYFLNQLLRNADKVKDAIKQVEAKIGAHHERVPVPAREGEEGAEDPKDPEDSEPEPETDDEREEREREEEQDDKDEMELRRRSNNSADRYGGGG